MATIKIEGIVFDTVTQPCEIADALRAVRVKRSMGQGIVETEIRSPVSQKRLKLQETSPADLDREIAFWDAACTLKTTGKRSRYAMRMRYS